MNHKWGSWRYLELNARIRKGILYPRRERVLVRSALGKIGCRYKELIPVLNPFYHGWKGKEDKAMQWLDFCVFMNGRMGVILFHPKRGQSGVKKHEKEAYEAKQRLLANKNIPILILKRNETSQVYELLIRRGFERK